MQSKIISLFSPVRLVSKPQEKCFITDLALGPETLQTLPKKTSQERCKLFSDAVGCLLSPSAVMAQVINRIGDRGKENPGIVAVLAAIQTLIGDDGLEKLCTVNTDSPPPPPVIIEPEAAAAVISSDKDFCC